MSLDAFRGLAILGMLLVNEKAFGPATPRQLIHARWGQGIHVADMVFPWFLFIVGVTMPLAVASRRERGATRWQHVFGVFRRTVILVLLGCLVSSSYARRPLFDVGVLQLIGLSYLVSAMLYGVPTRARLSMAAVLLVGYWALIRFLPVPGIGPGVFTASQNAIAYLNAAHLERYSLGGIMAVVPASALVLIGTGVGDFLRQAAVSSARKAALLALTGVCLVLVGWLWSLDLQFNKPVWTPSYVVFAAGWGSLALAVLYLLIDVKGWRMWAFPLIVAGMNAIFIFAVPILVKLHTLREWTWTMLDGSTLTVERALQNGLFVHLGRVPGGVLYTFCYILIWWLVVLWMYRRRIFLRV